jgi:large exoprotein involved in heme utilization and adhesion
VTLNVDRLIVRDGSLIGSGSRLGNTPVSSDRGLGGTLTINATDSVQVIGTGAIGIIPVNSSLFTQAQGTGNAGNLNIFTPNLTVRDGAEINLSAVGLGQAGNLKIESNNTQLDKGTITAATANGEGGNISLQAKDLLLLRNSSKISAQATGEASGGNINIDAGFVVANPNQNNDIIANAQRGRGGNISIATDGIFGLQQGKATLDNRTNDIDASSDFGFNGNISITTPDINPAKERVQSPESVVEPEEMTAQACRPNEVAEKVENNRESTFTISGRGGIPQSPTQPLIKDVIRVGGELSKPRSNSENVIKTAQALLEGKNTIDFDRHTNKQESKLVAIETNQTKKIHSEDIVPARGMMINEKGQVVLTAYPTSSNGDRLPVNSFNCQG